MGGVMEIVLSKLKQISKRVEALHYANIDRKMMWKAITELDNFIDKEIEICARVLKECE